MKSSTNGGAATDVASWLKTLPLAPEYHPTPLEFQDPIAYILKIEKEASQFGICKIIPPLPTATKKSTVSNLNHSFAARNPDDSPTFTTRQQQIGFCPRRPRPVQKPVWQSGERYTLTQFESKAKQFEREQLKKIGKKSFTPLEVETLFWRACAGKPFSVEYANDMPGSGFPPIGGDGSKEAGNVGESGWNMRTVSRARCSLLRFMKDDIPGVTSPMVYVGMMFSWFAWHVEDHDLHSLNYLHMGAGKTWYGVPRDACSAFEDVIRVQGYCEEVNPLVTFAILGEKTTVISPEVLIGAGIPCCRLVQNAGEFVVTFPGSYHSGFSHGFNCGEASNIATPEWLKVAKEAAVKRASTNYPPMVSHFQLLYALAVSLCSRMPTDRCSEPRSSRLKYKMKGEGEAIVKGLFVENVIQNNNLLALLLDKGSSCIVLPQNTSNSHLGSGPLARSLMTVKPRLSLGLCSRQEAVEASEVLFSNYAIPERNGGIRQLAGFYPVKVNPISVCQEKKLLSTKCSKFGNVNFHPSNMENMEGGKGSTFQGDGLLDKGLLSCATCGILSFACVAVIQPREAAARYLMSADCSVFNDSVIDSGEINDICISNMFSVPEHMESHVQSRSDGNLADCNTQSIEASAQNVQLVSDAATQKGISALDLLASAYGDYSDSEEEELFEMPACSDDKDSRDTAHSGQPCSISLPNICSSNIVPSETDSHLVEVDCQNVVTGSSGIPSKLVSGSAVPTKISCLLDVAANLRNLASISTEEKQLKMKFLAGNLPGNPELVVVNNLDADTKMGLSSLTHSAKDRHSFDGSSTEPDSTCHSTEISDTSETKMANPVSGSAGFLISSGSCCDSDSPTGITAIVTQDFNFDTSVKNSSISVLQRSNKDSSRMHVFCLEHAVEVERQLHPVGGVHIMLVCHPGYPKIEAEAKVLAKELGVGHFWKDIPYQEATDEDQRTIQSALQDEEAVPMKGDWSVKLGINLYYSANLSKSPIYSKQLPYNLVIYKAFGRNSTGSSLGKQRGLSRRRRIAVAGRWCGKVWMSNQVHPYLAHRNDIQSEDDEHDTDQKLLAETDIELTDFVSSPRRNLSNSTESGRKRKRKTVLLKLSDKRPKFGNLNSSDCIAEVSELFSPQGGRVSSKQAAGRNSTSEEVKDKPALRKPVVSKRTNKVQATVRVHEDEDPEYQCDMEGRSMSFESKRTKKVQPTTRVYEDEDTAYQCDMEGRSMSFGLKRTNKAQRTTRVHEDEDTEYQSDIEGRGMSFGSKKTKKVQPTTRVHEDKDIEYQCDIEGRSMSFGSKKMKKIQCTTRVHEDEDTEYQGDIEGRSMSFGSKKTKKIQCTTRVHEDEDTEYQGDIEGRSMSFGSKKTKKVQPTTRVDEEDAEYPCDMEGCSMSFGSKKDLVLHKRNICPEKDCRKKFFSHKYLVQHRKVHMDDRPLKCPWKGCKMAFKWPWARTEHIRVHTGDRPYICQEPGCDQTFRFVSDFSRHKRKTGHSAKKARR